MEIDLDNLVFNGLDEAEERNAERLDDADKKRRRLSPTTTAATPAKSNKKAPVLLLHSLYVTHTSFRHVSRVAQFSVTFYHGTTRVNVGNVDAIYSWRHRQD